MLSWILRRITNVSGYGTKRSILVYSLKHDLIGQNNALCTLNFEKLEQKDTTIGL